MRIARGSCTSLVCVFALLALGAPRASAEEQTKAVVAEGKSVSIEYTLTLDDGSTWDTNVGKDPLVYVQGEGKILPALETALEGLAVDDRVEVSLTPEKGYGLVDPERSHSVPAEQIPEEARKAGAWLLRDDGQGHQVPVRVREVNEERVVVDLNHPLAGRNLNFAVRIVSID